MPSAVSPTCSMNMIRAGTCFSVLQGLALLARLAINQAILRHLALRSRRGLADMGVQATGARYSAVEGSTEPPSNWSGRSYLNSRNSMTWAHRSRSKCYQWAKQAPSLCFSQTGGLGAQFIQTA